TAIPLSLLTAITVTVIAASYTRITERFPAGGGGYVVPTKLLGSGAGLVSGSALLVDYVLTVAISLAACSESIFSLVPPSLHFAYLPFTFGLLAALTILNLRGVRESVAVISPIFLLFILTHAIARRVFAPGNRLGGLLVALTLVSVGTLLFVAAQTGFLGGPRVVVYMAFDRWVPSRFSNLSERLVTSNGVLFIALSAGAVLL